MEEQKLTKMIDYFRNRLADEQLRLADAITTNQFLNEQLQERDAKILQLESELEGYRVPAETGEEAIPTIRPSIEPPY